MTKLNFYAPTGAEKQDHPVLVLTEGRIYSGTREGKVIMFEFSHFSPSGGNMVTSRSIYSGRIRKQWLYRVPENVKECTPEQVEWFEHNFAGAPSTEKESKAVISNLLRDTPNAKASEAAEEHAKAYAWAKKWVLSRAKNAIVTESLAKLTKKYGALAANPPALFIKHGYRWTENHGGLWMVPTENYKALMEEFLSPSEYALALEEYGNVDPETVGGSVLAKDYPLGSVSPSSEKIEPFSLDHKTAKDACENNLQQYVYKTQDEQQLEDIARKDKDLGLILLNAWVWVFGVAAACGIGYVVFKALLKWSI